MKKNFEINRTKIEGGCQSGRKVVTHNSKSDLALICNISIIYNYHFSYESFCAPNKSKIKSEHTYIFWKIIKIHQLVLVHSAKIANEQKTLEA